MEQIPKTHKAVAIVGIRMPLGYIEVPTVPPKVGEVVIHVHWSASTPLDLHQADGGLLVTVPQVSGDSAAGIVVAVGQEPNLKGLRVGDKVFVFSWRFEQEKAHQEYMTVPAYMVSKLPGTISLQEAATVPDNLVTAFHSLTRDLELDLPWPIPDGWSPPHQNTPILIWGAASSVGTYAIQVLHHWGYKNILAVSSAKHHENLREMGASACFGYQTADVADEVLRHAGKSEQSGPSIPFILDCIGSVYGTLERLTKIAQAGTKLALMLPVIVQDATEEQEPIYELDINKCTMLKWADGAIVRGVRTHFYLEVCHTTTTSRNLQSEISSKLTNERYRMNFSKSTCNRQSYRHFSSKA
jgi:NADPH:quinone reductase-like Zn-dependent oxidoreductase